MTSTEHTSCIEECNIDVLKIGRGKIIMGEVEQDETTRLNIVEMFCTQPNDNEEADMHLNYVSK